MSITLSSLHHGRLAEIKKSLSLLGSKESSFLQVELLFYEALEIAREYGNDLNENSLLVHLKELQENEYQRTKEKTKKSTQREQFIRRFILQFKKVLPSK
jgi:hypothetical protein